jgi:hypothetical protein
MKKIVSILILLNIFTSISAQIDTSGRKFEMDKLNYNASYYGETGWYPGVKIGAEYIIRETKKEKQKTSKKSGEFTKIKTNQFIITGNLGYYWQPHNYGSLFINSAILYRHTAHKGFQYNFGISPLGMNTFFFNETYEVSDDGSVDKKFLPTRFFYAPSLIMGLGHTMDKEKLSAWFVNLDITGLLPYNNAINFLAALEFGFRFNIEKFNK